MIDGVRRTILAGQDVDRPAVRLPAKVRVPSIRVGELKRHRRAPGWSWWSLWVLSDA